MEILSNPEPPRAIHRIHARWLSVISLIVLGISAYSASIAAQEINAHGYIDLRAVAAADTRSWFDGGDGKLRFGDHAESISPSAALDLSLPFAAEWLAKASVQAQPDSHAHIETLEAWLRYRPASTTRWRWSLRAGLMFPRISLENDGIGWISPSSLTPSAINSWVGEELRSTGIEWRLEHRGKARDISVGLLLFGGNDPAGEILAARGWAFSDRYLGLGSRLREPDRNSRDSPPRDFDPFVENDHAAGWQADIDIDSRRYGNWRLLYYDNRADPTSYRIHDGEKIFSWRTRFWSLGHRRNVGSIQLISQVMYGDTRFQPSPFFASSTRFWSGFILLTRRYGNWQPSLRSDVFGTREQVDSADAVNEHGHALTAALNWRPSRHWRLSAEYLRVDSQRSAVGRIRDQQAQLSIRWYF